MTELSEFFSKKKVSRIGLKLNGWIESKGGWVSEFNYWFYFSDANKSARYIIEFIGNLRAATSKVDCLTCDILAAETS